MKRSFFKEVILGAGYIANKGSKELHKVDEVSSKCRIEMITNGRYVWNHKRWLKKGYNGCKHCFPEKDNG